MDMTAKATVQEQVEKVRAYLSTVDVGSKEYRDAAEVLVLLEKELAEREKFDYERKDQLVKTCIDVGKFVIGGVVIPVGTTYFILKWEEVGSITTVLRNLLVKQASGKL